jgi:hypothetical protein
MIRKSQPESLQSLVREAIKAKGEMTVKQCRRALGLSGPAEYSRIATAMRDLARRGYIKRMLPATFVWIGEPADLSYRECQLKMARFMGIRTKKNEPFCAEDVSRVTECSHDWAKRYITALKERGLLALAGRIKGKTSPVPVYLATAEAMRVNPEDWPGMKRLKNTKETDEVRDQVRELAAEIFCSTRGGFDRAEIAGKAHLILEKLEGKT